MVMSVSAMILYGAREENITVLKEGGRLQAEVEQRTAVSAQVYCGVNLFLWNAAHNMRTNKVGQQQRQMLPRLNRQAILGIMRV